MLPEAHVCVACKQRIVWTDCHPALCYECREKERQDKAMKSLDKPIIIQKEKTHE